MPKALSDDSTTLIDTGYPGDHEKVLASPAHAGLEPENVTTVLVERPEGLDADVQAAR
ncbi:hypothetical protein AB0926_34070 [Streptomyces griseoincarnatus]|uniref:hypothetical protein n=1 Tax=Streptomyces sp. NPDC013172 TaxID=3155009 RepID=UPI0033ED9292